MDLVIRTEELVLKPKLLEILSDCLDVVKVGNIPVEVVAFHCDVLNITEVG